MFYPALTLKKLHFMVFKLSNILSFCALFSALTILTINAQAVENENMPLTKVYKVIGADGSVSFSDQPEAESETILVPPISTVPAITPGKTALITEVKEDKSYNRYHSLEIIAPANNSAFYSGSGDVDVLLDVQPALIDGDKIQIFLDGQLMSSNNDIQSRLQTISRGTHELRVKLISNLGKVHKEVFSTFTLHRPSIKD